MSPVWRSNCRSWGNRRYRSRRFHRGHNTYPRRNRNERRYTRSSSYLRPKYNYRRNRNNNICSSDGFRPQSRSQQSFSQISYSQQSTVYPSNPTAIFDRSLGPSTFDIAPAVLSLKNKHYQSNQQVISSQQELIQWLAHFHNMLMKKSNLQAKIIQNRLMQENYEVNKLAYGRLMRSSFERLSESICCELLQYVWPPAEAVCLAMTSSKFARNIFTRWQTLDSEMQQQLLAVMIRTGNSNLFAEFMCAFMQHIEKIELATTNWQMIQAMLVYHKKLHKLVLNCGVLKTLVLFEEFPDLLGSELTDLEIFNIKVLDTHFEIPTLMQILCRYGTKLHRLALDRIRPMELDKLPMLAELRSLDISLTKEYCAQQFGERLLPKLSLDKMESLSLDFKLPNEYLLEHIFDWLKSMTSLKQLAISIRYRKRILVESLEGLQKIRNKIEQDLKTLQLAAPIEVFRLSVSTPRNIVGMCWRDMVLNYQQLLPALTNPLTFLRKLIIQVPESLMPSNCLQIDFSQLTKASPKLETLLINYESNRTLATRADRIIKLFQADQPAVSIKHLTFIHLPVLNRKILINLSQVFPNLVELNIGAEKAQIYYRHDDFHINQIKPTFDDHDLATMMTNMSQLCVFRFTDNFIKPLDLSFSIQVLLTRANTQVNQQLRNHLFRVPLSQKQLQLFSMDSPLFTANLGASNLQIF